MTTQQRIGEAMSYESDLEAAARKYASNRYPGKEAWLSPDKEDGFLAGVAWQRERENAALKIAMILLDDCGLYPNALTKITTLVGEIEGE